MKKIVSLLLVCALLLTVVGCNSSNGNATSGENTEADVQEQSYPEKAIEVVIPFSAGGVTDVLGRVLEKYAPEHIPNEQRLVIVNKPGGASVTGTTEMLAAKTDGYTIGLFPPGSVVIQPHLGNATYTLDDFKPVIRIADAPILLVVSKDSEIDSLDEWVEYIKENPGQFKIASGGIGNTPHVALVKYLNAAGLNEYTSYVPYKSSAEAYSAMLGGHIDGYISSAQSLASKKDDVKVLVNLGSSSNGYYKDAPTLKDLGYEGLETDAWFGVLGSKDLSDEIIDTLHDSFKSIIEDEEVIKTCEDMGIVINYASAEDFKAQLEKEYEDYSEVLEELGLKK